MEGKTPAGQSPRERYTALLRDLASLMDEHDEFPEPYVREDGLLHFACHSASAGETLAALMRVLGGTWAKAPLATAEDEYVEFRGAWRGYPVLLTTSRAVAEAMSAEGPVAA